MRHGRSDGDADEDKQEENGSAETETDIDADPYKPSHRYAQLGAHGNRRLYQTPSPTLSPSSSSSSSPLSAVDRFFCITERGSSIVTECRAGLVTFATMAYIIIVNAQILSGARNADGSRLQFDGVVTATAISAAAGTGLVGLWGNLPFGLAAGMGLNSYFTFGVVIKLGLSWQVALTACFVHGLLFLCLSLLGACNLIQLYAPPCIKKSITVGLGLFQALIGFEQMRLVVQGREVLLTLGDVEDVRLWLSISGLMLISVLMLWRVKAAMLLGMVAITLLGWGLRLEPAPSAVVQWPTLGNGWLCLDFSGYWANIAQTGVVTVMLLFVSVFDTAGVQIMAAERAELLSPAGHLSSRESTAAFVSASIASCLGALLGSSPIIIHTECCAGIADGARTGLSSVVVAALFVLVLPFVPVLHAVPSLVTAPCLVIVGCLMMAVVKFLDWERMDEAVPAFLTCTLIAFTYSIANGVIAGIVAFVILKAAAFVAGQFSKTEPEPLSVLSSLTPPAAPPGLERRRSSSMLYPLNAGVAGTPSGLTSRLQDDPMPGSPSGLFFYAVRGDGGQRGRGGGVSGRSSAQPLLQGGYGAVEQTQQQGVLMSRFSPPRSLSLSAIGH